MIEMDVHTGHDMPLKVVLDRGESSGEIAHMMVVDECDRGNHFTVRLAAPLLIHQLIANKIAKRLRPRGIFPPPDNVIKLIEQMMIQRDAKSDELLHFGCYDYKIRVTEYSDTNNASQFRGVAG